MAFGSCSMQPTVAKRKAAFYDGFVKPLVKEGTAISLTGEELLSMVDRAIKEGEQSC